MTSSASATFTLPCGRTKADESFTISQVPDSATPTYKIESVVSDGQSVMIQGPVTIDEAIASLRVLLKQKSGVCPDVVLSEMNGQTIEGSLDSGYTVTGSLLGSKRDKAAMIAFFESDAFKSLDDEESAEAAHT